MKYTDMIKGEIYSIKSTDLYIFRFARMDHNNLYMGAYGYRFEETPIFYTTGGGWGSSCLDTIEIPSQELIEWFMACEVIGKAVKNLKKYMKYIKQNL